MTVPRVVALLVVLASGCAGVVRSTDDMVAAVAVERASVPRCTWRSFPAQIGFGLASSEYQMERQLRPTVLAEVAEFFRNGTIERIRLIGHLAGDCEAERRHPSIAAVRARVVFEHLVALGVPESRIEHGESGTLVGPPEEPDCDPRSIEWHPQRVVFLTALFCSSADTQEAPST